MTPNSTPLRLFQLRVLALIAMPMLILSCSSSTTPPPSPRTGTITQAMLDAATIPLQSGIAGDPFSAFSPGGKTDTLTVMHKLRDLTGSINQTTAISEGTVLVRKSWYIKTPTSTNRDSVLNFVVMVKREPGYYPTGGDWEYIKIPYNKTTDYVAHPFGMLPTDTSTTTLPDSTKTNVRGRLQVQCATCHQGATGSDFLFTR